MTPSEAGFAGAAVGLVLGIADYLIAGRMAERKLRAAQKEVEPQDKDAFERKVANFKRLLFASTVLVFPFIGYFVGRQFGGQ
jgi:hypothetical protein